MNLFDINNRRLKEVCEAIGAFYLYKNSGNYEKTAEGIQSLGIQNIIVADKIVIIFTSRPGRLIGKKGRDITDLEDYLRRSNLKIKSISIVEVNDINDLIIPEEEDHLNDDYWELINGLAESNDLGDFYGCTDEDRPF